MQVEVNSTSEHEATVIVDGTAIGRMSMCEGCAIIISSDAAEIREADYETDEEHPFFGAFMGNSLRACAYAIAMCVDGVDSVAYNGEVLYAARPKPSNDPLLACARLDNDDSGTEY